MSAVEVDVVRLHEVISYRLFRTGKPAREVAKLLGFSPQVFSDIKAAAAGRNVRGAGRKPYAPGGAILLTICWWLDADPRDFQKVSPDALPIGEIDKVLATVPADDRPLPGEDRR